MGCTSNSSVEVNKIEKDEKNFEEPLEAEELPIIFNKEKKQLIIVALVVVGLKK